MTGCDGRRHLLDNFCPDGLFREVQFLRPMRVLVFLLCLPVFFVSCSSDAELPEDAAAQLAGRWELVEARRDNVKTGLLDGLYLVFGAAGQFETNLLTDAPQRGTYQREEEEVTTAGVEMPLTYDIIALEGDVLTLQARIEGYIFNFLLRRAATTGGSDPGQNATTD